MSPVTWNGKPSISGSIPIVTRPFMEKTPNQTRKGPCYTKSPSYDLTRIGTVTGPQLRHPFHSRPSPHPLVLYILTGPLGTLVPSLPGRNPFLPSVLHFSVRPEIGSRPRIPLRKYRLPKDLLCQTQPRSCRNTGLPGSW